MNARSGESVTVQARAKINLYLHVLARRKDGYHELDSLFVFGELADVIQVKPARSLRFKSKGPFAERLPDDQDNLILRAAQLLADAVEVKPDAAITLTKNLPVAAGLGGGSAYAAATLRALAALWKIPPEAVDLTLLGLGIGADVPACLLSEPCYVGGIGERIDPVTDLPAFPTVLANPGMALPTVSVFGARKQKYSKRSRFRRMPTNIDELVSRLKNRRNDLQSPAIKLCPVIADMLQTIESTDGCRLARLSGSGASCFGIYREIAEAHQAAQILQRRGWWAEATMTASAERPWENL